ncbi:hypothetical protein Ae168Ps1_5015c [Pseudonocardia sp. Ae168_Ps1]|nr:hypothetical protein Ae150APs1_1312c [Pseudonocardia sp. Ae150A_Ps1]OLL78910.1 hypothetical protein Ae168Ps1_1316c [Pseudonocardia sp. Ae168_Ps1]OLL84664.1 hypothetical protein Ae263Ps1_1719 [Pseudonocardia sp. Ae263_Ps1]OLL95319.1 hypothetical protein Ae356Ps1_5216c [Pseudonocardia sp. Ae356_Ps1]OLL73631.1 hypothetical protein Ae150APs1_2009c [Pseudonocardia sp. Ae150A_Ps1]
MPGGGPGDRRDAVGIHLEPCSTHLDQAGRSPGSTNPASGLLSVLDVPRHQLCRMS